MNNPSDKKKNNLAGIIRNFLRGKHSAEGEKLFDTWWEQESASEDILSPEERTLMSDRVLQRLKLRLPGHEAPEPAIVRRIGRRRQLWWSAAAVLLLTIGAGAYYAYRPAYSDQEKDWLMVVTKAGEKRKLLLADGTAVTLNENSQISYPQTYSGRDKRAIRLEGEAYFEVAKDPAHPFLVMARQASIKVLGTSFSVWSHQKDSSVVVAMQDGKVSLADRRNELDTAIILQKGDIGILSSSGQLSNESGMSDSENYFSWVNDRGLSFDGTPLSQVLVQLERIYGVRIVCNETSLKTRKITLQYPATDLPTMLNVIGKAMHLQIFYTDHVYHIK